MTLLYADTSALVRAYLADEPDHLELRAAVLEGSGGLITSEIARVEFASSIRAAAEARRVSDHMELLDQFDADCQPDGRIRLVELRTGPVLRTAKQLVLDHRLRTLDAIHLAVAVEERDEMAIADLVFLTRDEDQATAARALGFEVA